MVKLLITGAALFFVFKKIDVDQFREVLSNARWGLFLLAILTFNLSKIVAAFRLRSFYGATGLQLPAGYNLRLYYLGMFYNMFLPGSIGGDGYKVFLLRQHYNTPTPQLIAATLLDRLSGLMILTFLSGVLLSFSTLDTSEPWVTVLIAVTLLLPIPAFYLAIRLFFSRFMPVFGSTTLYSVVVQVGQLVCAMCILWALNIDSHYIDYLTLFMCSSVIAVIPFTVGGVGARELVFLYADQYMQVQEAASIAFTILFFLVMAITALFGLIFAYRIDNVTGSTETAVVSGEGN